MPKEKRHYVTEEEIVEVMEKNNWDRDKAEAYFIQKYDEAIFPDEYDKADEIYANLKKNLKVANVYDNKKGKRGNTRKPDDDKRYLIDFIAKAIDSLNIEVTNIEREIKFSYNGFDYSLVLTKHRKEKNEG